MEDVLRFLRVRHDLRDGVRDQRREVRLALALQLPPSRLRKPPHVRRLPTPTAEHSGLKERSPDLEGVESSSYRGGCVVEHFADDVAPVLAGRCTEGDVAGQQLEDADADRPDVGAPVDLRSNSTPPHSQSHEDSHEADKTVS